MSIVRWNPFGDGDGFFSPAYRDFLNFPELKQLQKTWKPLVDITEDEKEYLVKAELPEVKRKI